MEKLNNELLKLIGDSFLLTDLELESLSINTCIEKDFGIFGEEAEDFILLFSKQFNVNINNFVFRDYFESEGVRFFSKKKHPKDLTIGMLNKAIETGVLQ